MNLKRDGIALFVFILVVSAGGGMAFGHEEGEEHMPTGNPDAKPALPPSILAEIQQTEKKPPIQEMVRAKKFELVDSEGRVRALFEMTQEDEPRVVFADREGKVQAILGVEPVPRYRDGIPALRLFDRKGKKRLDIDLNIEGDPEISLHNQNGAHIASLSGMPTVDGGTQWLLSDPNGQVRVNLSVNHAGTNLLFMDENNKTRAKFGLKPGGSPVLVVLDEEGIESPVPFYTETIEQKSKDEIIKKKNVSSLPISE